MKREGLIASKSRYRASAKLEGYHQSLSALSVSKPSDNGGSNLAVDARRARKRILEVDYEKKVRPKHNTPYRPDVKPVRSNRECPDTRIRTHGRTDRDTCSYFKAKLGDNLGRQPK